VSQHAVRGLRAGQDGSSELGDEGAVLALDLAAGSQNVDGHRILGDELAVVRVAAMPALVMRVPSDRANAAAAARFAIPACG